MKAILLYMLLEEPRKAGFGDKKHLDTGNQSLGNRLGSELLYVWEEGLDWMCDVGGGREWEELSYSQRDQANSNLYIDYEVVGFWSGGGGLSSHLYISRA